MNSRLNNLDYIRSLAILMIITCHYFLFSDLSDGIGRYLAGVGNIIFFLLSALLYGIKLDNDNSWALFFSFDFKSFFIKKIFKFGASLWPFLMVLVGLFCAFDISFSWIDVILNFVFLGYLRQLPGNGHLWFLTVMMACYVEYALLAKLKISVRWFPFVFLPFMIGMMVIAEMLEIPGSAFAVLGFYGFVLLKTDFVIKMSKSLKLWSILFILVFNVYCFWLFANGLFESSRIAAYFLSECCGFMLLVLFLRIFPNKHNSVISFISNISFEMYIVHHTLCQGPFFRISNLHYPHLCKFIILLIITILLAFILKRISLMLHKCFVNHLKI